MRDALTPPPIAPPGPGTPGVAHRAAWTLTSQGLSSASNFLLTLLVLSNVPGRAFAVFALCLTIYLLLVQLARYVVGIPVLVTHGSAGRREGARGAVGLATWAGLSLAPALLGGAVFWDAGRGVLIVLAVSVPVLLAQDALRHVAIADGRPQAAAAGDGVWVVVQLIASWLVIRSGDPSATALTAAWAAAGAVSTVLLAGWLATPPSAWDGARRWVGDHVELCRRVAVEFAVNSGSYYVLSFGLAALAGTSELGYLRGAQTLFGPASVLLLGGAMLGVPESVRIRADGHRLLRFAALLSGGLAVLSVACGIAVYALLPRIGPSLFPDTWEPIRAVMPWLTVFGTAIGVGAGPIASLRAIEGSRWMLLGRGVTAALALAVGLPASMWFGAKGTFAGLGLAEILLAMRAWAELHRRVHRAEGDRHG